MSDKIRQQDACAVQVAGPGGGGGEYVPSPRFMGDFVCAGPTPDGQGTQILWEDRWHNIVVDQGRYHLMNVAFGGLTSSTAGKFLFLHNQASPASNSSWGDISTGRITNISNNSYPTLGFTTNIATNSFSTSATLAITAAGAQTMYGAGIFFYTSASCGTAPTAGDVRLYCYGTFTGGSQQVNNGNSISATITLTFGT